MDKRAQERSEEFWEVHLWGKQFGVYDAQSEMNTHEVATDDVSKRTSMKRLWATDRTHISVQAQFLCDRDSMVYISPS